MRATQLDKSKTYVYHFAGSPVFCRLTGRYIVIDDETDEVEVVRGSWPFRKTRWVAARQLKEVGTL